MGTLYETEPTTASLHMLAMIAEIINRVKRGEDTT